jgi:hypothetical protein
MYIIFCLEKLKERDHLEAAGADRKTIPECIPKK